MSSRDPHQRARGDDRDATVERIEAAYVDGQITGGDRDLRVANAQRAATLGELDMLTRDLRAPSHPVVPVSAVPVPHVPVAPVAPVVQYTPYAAPARRPTPRRTGRVSTAVVAALALAVVGVGTAVTGLFTADFGGNVEGRR